MRALPLLAILLFTVAGCASRPVAPPAPPAPPVRPAPSPAPMPPPAPAPAPLAADWRDWPFSPGTWTWRADARGSIAVFGAVEGSPEIILRCDRPTQRIILSRAGRIGRTAQMTIRTDFGTLSWPAEDGSGTPAFVAASRSAGDIGLDQIAYSRGRFTVELPGMAPLVLRPWAEISRVIEDCR